MRYLQALTNLEVLNLPTVPFDDQTLQAVRLLKKLRQLRCFGSKITDDGLLNLRGLVNLESLTMTGAKISIDGLKQLSQLPALREVALGSLDVTFNGKSIPLPATIGSHKRTP